MSLDGRLSQLSVFHLFTCVFILGCGHATSGSADLLLPVALTKPEMHSLIDFGAESEEAAAPTAAQSSYRLPDTIVPLEYYLSIVPDITGNTFSFTGQVTIKIVPTVNTTEIVLHAVGLNLDESSVSVTLSEAPVGAVQEINVTGLAYDNATQQVSILVSPELRPAVGYDLSASYTGQLWTKMLGFYRSWYMHGNDTRWLATTQFESTFARAAFPCFDEPRFRANFTVRIAHFENSTAISNMPRASVSQPDPAVGGRVWDLFQTTPKMASYLLAFSVFDFVNVTQGRASVWAEPGFEEEAAYIVGEVPVILETLENFTRVEYQLPKADLVAVPDFNAGAMENWGMTTYREKYLLFRSNVSTLLDRQWILAIVAHELAHQWFGDLVTPSWWDYTWLNEAFATYYEYFVPDQMEPTWRMMEQFVVRELQTALASDEGGGHPVTGNVSTPAEIDAIFDVFSYNKGGSLLRMLQHFLGLEVYRNGTTDYLRHGVADLKGTVTPAALWESFNRSIPDGTLPAPIADIMSTWFDQRGFPLINVIVTNETVTVTQEAFLRTPVTKEEQKDVGSSKSIAGQQWWVPLTYTTQAESDFNDTLPRAWLAPNASLVVPRSDDGWVLFNIQQSGYYRVNYDEGTWTRLTDQLKGRGKLRVPPVNRAQLIDDAFVLASAGKLNYTIALNLSQSLALDYDYIPWFVGMRHWSSLLRRFRGTSVGDELQDRYQKLITNAYSYSINWAPSSRTYSMTLFITATVTEACEAGLERCEQELNTRFQEWLASDKDDPQSLDPDLKYAVLCTGLRLGDHVAWTAVWDYYVASNITTEKSLLLQALGCTANATSIDAYLSHLTGDLPSEIRSQDYISVFRSLVYHPQGVSALVDYLITNCKLLLTRLKPNMVKTFFAYLGSVITDDGDRKKLVDFAAQNATEIGEGVDAAVNATLKAIDRNRAWTDKYAPAIALYLQSTANTTAQTTAAPGGGNTTTGEPTHHNTTTTTPKPSASSWNTPSATLLAAFLLVLAVASSSSPSHSGRP